MLYGDLNDEFPVSQSDDDNLLMAVSDTPPSSTKSCPALSPNGVAGSPAGASSSMSSVAQGAHDLLYGPDTTLKELFGAAEGRILLDKIFEAYQV